MSYQHLSTKTPTTRKRHVCEFCGKFINPGTQYVNQFAVDGGDVMELKAHELCYEYMQHFIEFNGDEYPEFDQAECDRWHAEQEQKKADTGLPGEV